MRRATSVYGEHALGITDEEEHSPSRAIAHIRTRHTNIATYLQQQLAYGMRCVLLCTWICTRTLSIMLTMGKGEINGAYRRVAAADGSSEEELRPRPRDCVQRAVYV